MAVTGTVTLDGQGNANAVWVFQMGSTLTTGTTANIALIGGAQAKNVWWQDRQLRDARDRHHVQGQYPGAHDHYAWSTKRDDARESVGAKRSREFGHQQHHYLP